MYFGNIPVRVGAIEQETATIKRFRLYPLNGEPLPVFGGGSHITTIVNNGEEVLERHYSLVSPPLERNFYEIAIRRDDESRGGSVYWHDQMEVGDELEITFPKNQFALSFQAKHHVFYAAGIGITPFITMMSDLKAEGKTFELHYAAKSKELCAFYDDLIETYPTECTFYFSEEGNKLSPEGMQEHLIGTHVYFCGPQSMVKQFTEAARDYGYSNKSIHFEVFAPQKFKTMDAFQVVLKQSEKVIDVPEGETLLDTLLGCGVNARYSCKVGGCGSCEVEVIAGDVEHRDTFYSDEERTEKNIVMACVSRAKSKRLVLNL